MTSFDPEWSKRIDPQFLNAALTLLRKDMEVSVDTLMSILEPHSRILRECVFCSIDVEGYEEQVLRGIDFDVFHPNLMVLESRRFGTHEPTYPMWEPILLRAGYKHIRSTTNGVNRFYWREPQKKILFYRRKSDGTGRDSV